MIWKFASNFWNISQKTLVVQFNFNKVQGNGFKYYWKKSRNFFSGNTSLGRPYRLIFLKGCLPQILRGPILNTLTHIFQRTSRLYHPSFFKCCCPQILYGQFSKILSQISCRIRFNRCLFIFMAYYFTSNFF